MADQLASTLACRSVARFEPRMLASGMAEVVKCGVALDGEFFGWLEENAGAIRGREPGALERMVALVGESELSAENQLLYKRAKKLRNFMTQAFFTAEEQSGRKGVYVPMEETVKGVAEIISGKYDQVPEERFLYIGKADEVTHE